MLICDLHCDLPSLVADGKRIPSNDGHWSLDKLQKEHIYVQVFASFVDKLVYDNPFERVDSLIHGFLAELKASGISVVTEFEQLEKNISQGKASAILSIEGGEALGGRIENVRYFYELGIRFMTITWNRLNQLGASSDPSCCDMPLSPFGIDVIKEMNRLKMTPDVSHLSEAGFWSVAEVSTMPFCATHSNSRKICNHHRNLTDEQFVAIKKVNGLVGINFAPMFLEEEQTKAGLLSIVKHIEHFMSLGGEENVCLGGDLDGIDSLPDGLESVGDVHKIADELLKLNYGEELVKKIMGENVKSYLKMVL